MHWEGTDHMTVPTDSPDAPFLPIPTTTPPAPPVVPTKKKCRNWAQTTSIVVWALGKFFLLFSLHFFFLTNYILGYEYVAMADPPLGHQAPNPGTPCHRCEPLLAGWKAGWQPTGRISTNDEETESRKTRGGEEMAGRRGRGRRGDDGTYPTPASIWFAI
jgi:hypothetical protein